MVPWGDDETHPVLLHWGMECFSHHLGVSGRLCVYRSILRFGQLSSHLRLRKTTVCSSRVLMNSTGRWIGTSRVWEPRMGSNELQLSNVHVWRPGKCELHDSSSWCGTLVCLARMPTRPIFSLGHSLQTLKSADGFSSPVNPSWPLPLILPRRSRTVQGIKQAPIGLLPPTRYVGQQRHQQPHPLLFHETLSTYNKPLISPDPPSPTNRLRQAKALAPR